MSFIKEADVFLEENLKSYGFKKLKGTHIFGKFINDEIFYYIYLDKANMKNKGNNFFKIKSGIRTIYSVNLTIPELKNTSLELLHYYCINNEKIISPNATSEIDLGFFPYNEDKNEFEFGFDYALQNIEKIVIPAFSTVTDILSYIEFAKKTSLSSYLSYADKLFADSVILVANNIPETFEETIDVAISTLKRNFPNESDPIFIEAKKQSIQAINETMINPLQVALASKELQDKAKLEMEKRKCNNTIQLKQYGF